MIRNFTRKLGQATYLLPVVGIKIHGLVELMRGSRDFQSADYWNDSLKGWAVSYLGGNFSNELRNSVTVLLAKQVVPKASSILDLGCAGGSLIHALGPEFENYHGVDISDVAISNAREALVASGLRPSLHYQLDVSTVQDYEPTRKFDVIVFNEVMYYISLKQVVEVVRRYSGFLSHDGVILVSLKDQTQCKSILSLLTKELDSVHAVVFQEQFGRADWKIVENRETPAFLVHAFRAKKSGSSSPLHHVLIRSEASST